MGRYSGSESSPSNRNRKGTWRRRSSSRSSSGSRYSSRSRKSKKYKKSRRSRSREKRSKSSRDGSRDRHRSRRSRTPSKQRDKRSDSRSRSRDGGGGGSRKSRSRSRKRSRSKDRKYKRSSRSRSHSSSTTRDDGSDLLMKLNRAAVEAMSDKFKNIQDNETTLESQMIRDKAIKEINASSFVQRIFSSVNKSENQPIVIDITAPTSSTVVPGSLPGQMKDSLLHPNMLMERHEDKMNRWVRKLYQIRQRSINGEPLDLA